MFKRKKYKREKNGIRVTTYVLLMVIIICVYLSCQYIFAWSWLTETVATIIAIISVVAFWVEYHENKIDDLMSYRYFVAMNNPVVQKLELLEYSEFYKGCFAIYEAWVKVLERQGITPPMYDKETNNLVNKVIQQDG